MASRYRDICRRRHFVDNRPNFVAVAAGSLGAASAARLRPGIDKAGRDECAPYSSVASHASSMLARPMRNSNEELQAVDEQLNRVNSLAPADVGRVKRIGPPLA
ncbi:hypothetical protein [Paraburkholderia monticola]|uniref:hypothetical protein n=1 Tax=Paraburkholderia monticola TaxID=1399968 RepID=UPI001290437E|nr:hypothetical protein [Paraburkholderia monticola]